MFLIALVCLFVSNITLNNPDCNEILWKGIVKLLQTWLIETESNMPRPRTFALSECFFSIYHIVQYFIIL